MKTIRRMVSCIVILSLIITMFVPDFAASANADSSNKVFLMNVYTYDDGIDTWTKGFIPKVIINNPLEKVKVADLTINWESVSVIPGSERLEFGDGRYWMDPDEPLYPRTRYSVRYSFEVTDPSIFEDITAVQMYLGPTAFHDSGYQVAEMRIEGHRVYVTASAKPYSLEISRAALQAVSVEPIYKKPLPQSLTLLNGAPFTSGAIQWYFFDNGTIKPVTTATYMADLAQNKYYYLKVNLRAGNLFEFNTTSASFYNGERPDGLSFSVNVIKDSTGAGYEAEVTITHIVPEVIEEDLKIISEITAETEFSFGTQAVALIADVRPYLPKALKVKLYGTDEETTIPFTSITKNIDNWHIYAVSGNGIGAELSDAAIVQKGDDIEYVAIYPYSALLRDIEESELTDVFHLIDTYRYDVDYPGAAGHEEGYAIRFTVRPVSTYNGAAQDGYRNMDVPSLNFVYNGANCIYQAVGQCANAVECVVNPLLFEYGTDVETAFNPGFNVYGVCSSQPGIYKAINQGIQGYTVDSAILYKYFNPEDLKYNKMQVGSITILTQVPETGAVASDDVTVAASYDYEKGLDTASAKLRWTPEPMSINSNYEEFLDETVYTAVVTVPIRRGYTFEKIPSISFNGLEPTEVTVTEKELIVKYVFPETEPEYWIDEHGACRKKIYFTTPKPYAGMQIPDKVIFSDTCSKMVKIKEIKWYENSTEVAEGTFKKGARYTLSLILDMSQAGVKASLGNIEQLIGTPDYVTHAYVSSETGLLTINFDFGTCESAEVSWVRDCVVTLPNNITYEMFINMLDTTHYTELVMADGSVTVTPIAPGYKPDNQTVKYDTFSAAYHAKYIGALEFDETSKAEQVFTFDALVDLRPMGGDREEYITLTVIVPGEACLVTFDANGGRYFGAAFMEVEAGTSYGFTYYASDYSREGYLFAGWYTAANGGTRVYSSSIVTENITLYAHWVKVFTGKVYNVTAVSPAKSTLTVTPKHPATKIAGYEVSVSYDGKNWETTSFTGDTVMLTGLKTGAVYVKVRAYRIDSAGKRVYGAYSWPKKVNVQ